MMHIWNFFMLKKSGIRFLKYNILSTFIFAFLYWIQDLLLTDYPKISAELYLGKSSPPAVSFQYYLWYSLITQTTVGYGGMLHANGDCVPYQKIKEVPLKVLNFMQLFSIFFIAATLM